MIESATDLKRMLHDLRNPFATIYTVTSVIQEMPDDLPLSEVRRQMRLIEQAIARVTELIDAMQRRLDESESNERPGNPL